MTHRIASHRPLPRPTSGTKSGRGGSRLPRFVPLGAGGVGGRAVGALAVPGLLLAGADKSAPVTHLGMRLVWTAVVLLVIAGMYLLMWRGWKARGRRQSDVPPPPPLPPDVAEGAEPPDLRHGPVEVVYVSTTTAGDWLDRIVVHSLGVRSNAEVSVTGAGVLIERQGAPALWIPAAQLRGAHTATGMAGKFVGANGLVVLEWQLGPRQVDTGLRCERQADREPLLAALTALTISPGRATGRSTNRSTGSAAS